MVAEYSLSSPAFGARDSVTVANLWVAALIAVGKVGAVVSSLIMHRYWVAPEKNQGHAAYKPLFFMVMLGGLSVLLLPFARYFEKVTHPAPPPFVWPPYVCGGSWLLPLCQPLFPRTHRHCCSLAFLQTVGMTMVFAGVFLFFFFSTPPKIGFDTLMQVSP